MPKTYPFRSILILASLLAGCAPSAKAQTAGVKSLEQSQTPISVPATSSSGDCPVTTAENVSFQAPEPYSPEAPSDAMFWYGSEELWTALPANGVWWGLPHNPEGYTQKIFWWRDRYLWNEEPQPDLSVTGERVDTSAPPLIVSRATNAYADDIGSAMLVGVDFPTLGCWKLTGRYADAELSFVVWVAP